MNISDDAAFASRADCPGPYSTLDDTGKKTYHGLGLSWLGQANLRFGGSPSPETRDALMAGYCCAEAMRTNWHGRSAGAGE